MSDKSSIIKNFVAEEQSKLPDMLFKAFAEAETGSFKNKYIRTAHQPKGGSSAFGPVQITHTKLLDYLERNDKNKIGLSPESIKFAQEVMLPMQNLMLKYGGKDMKPGYEDYDYGGSGKFDIEKYGPAYEKLAKEMLMYDYKLAGGDINKTIKSWRGVSNDERYNKIVRSMFKK